jgi:hypothetical protein
MGLLYTLIADLFFNQEIQCPLCKKKQRKSAHESGLYVKCEYRGKLIPLVKEPKGPDDYSE